MKNDAGGSVFLLRSGSIRGVVSLLLASGVVLAGCHNARTAPPKTSDQAETYFNYRWVDLYWHGRTIYQVGGQRLTAGITLPGWFHPLGNKALVADETPEMLRQHQSILEENVSLWLPSSQSQHAQHWMNRFPAEFITPLASYSVQGDSTQPVNPGTGNHTHWPKVHKLGQGWVLWADLTFPAKRYLGILSLPVKVPSGPADPKIEASPNLDNSLIAPASPLPPGGSVIQLRVQSGRRK